MIQTDVMVIGGGPAGMNAALAAAESGHRSYWLINFRNLVVNWSSRHTSFLVGPSECWYPWV